ncbi:MAG: autotransporter-associated beta strand repeat-containing protein [Sphingomonas taxi]
MKNNVTRMLRRAASRAAIAAGIGAVSVAAGAAPAVYFNQDLNAGRTAFLNTAAAADAAYNAAHPGATQSSTIFRIDLTNSIGSQFSVLDSASGTTVYVRTTRAGQPALNNTTGDAGGDGFTGWSVSYNQGDFNSAIAAGYNMSFYSDAGYTTPYLINAIGLNVSDWGTCCTYQNTTPNGGTADASQIYMLFNGSTPLLLGGISAPIGGTEHFIAAIDDRNAFSSVTMVPNGLGEYFGAGGELIFSTLQLNSVPANSSVVTVGGGLPTTTPDIVQTVNYTPDDVNTGAVNPVFDGGTLNLDQGGTITPDITITNGGGTIDTQGHDVTVSGNVDDAAGNSGGLIKTGQGTLTLTGTNGYTGGTTILDGTLRGGTGSLQGNIANAATIEFAQDSDGGFGGDITGAGNLVKSGTGTVTISTAQGYTGGTTISGGTLALTGAGDISSSGGIDNRGTLDIGGTTDGASIRSIAGNGGVTLGNQTLTVTNATGGFGGTIQGAGGLTLGGGTLMLTAAQDYNGDTVITGGSTLGLGGAGDGLVKSGRVVANGTFDVSGATTDAAVRSLGGNGTVALGNRNLVVTSGVDSFGGTIGGTGGLEVRGGTLTLTSANAFTGDTVIDGGATLGLGGNGALAGTGRVFNSGTFDISTTNHPVSIASIAGNGTVALGGSTLTLAQSAGTYAGSIGGTGGVTVAGGTLTLTGANGFSGGLRIDNAIVRAGADAALGGGAISIGNGALQATGGFSSAKAITLTAPLSTIDTGANAGRAVGRDFGHRHPEQDGHRHADAQRRQRLARPRHPSGQRRGHLAGGGGRFGRRHLAAQRRQVRGGRQHDAEPEAPRRRRQRDLRYRRQQCHPHRHRGWRPVPDQGRHRPAQPDRRCLQRDRRLRSAGHAQLQQQFRGQRHRLRGGHGRRLGFDQRQHDGDGHARPRQLAGSAVRRRQRDSDGGLDLRA